MTKTKRTINRSINIELPDLIENLFDPKAGYISFRAGTNHDHVQCFVAEPWDTVLGDASLMFGVFHSGFSDFFQISFRKDLLGESRSGMHNRPPSPYLTVKLGFGSCHRTAKNSSYKPSIIVKGNIKRPLPLDMERLTLHGKPLRAYNMSHFRNLVDRNAKMRGFFDKFMANMLYRMKLNFNLGDMISQEECVLSQLERWYRAKDRLTRTYAEYSAARLGHVLLE